MHGCSSSGVRRGLVRLRRPVLGLAGAALFRASGVAEEDEEVHHGGGMGAVRTRGRAWRRLSWTESRREGGGKVPATPPFLEDGSPGYLFEQFRVPRGCLGYV